MASPLLSIITVTSDCESAAFAKTAESLSTVLDREDVEWLIVPAKPGTAMQGTVLEPVGSGIYPAMNAGLEAASGAYLWFLNGGDRLTSPDSVAALLSTIAAEQPDFIYADSREFDDAQPDQIWAKPARAHRHWRLGMFTHHQSMVYRRDLAPMARYPTNYDVAADYGFTLIHLRAAQTVCRLPFALSDVSRGGFSTQHQDRGRVQQHQLRCQLGHVPRPLSIAIKGMQQLSQAVRRTNPTAWQRMRTGVRAS